MVVMDSDDLYARAQQWSEGGGLWRPIRCEKPRWDGELFCGLNYRMSELEGTVLLVQFQKMEAQLNRWRTNKRRIMSALVLYKELKPQIIHDIDGEMGHTIGFFPENSRESELVVAALRAEGIVCGTRGENPSSDWHYYQHMDMILQKLPATSDRCPWDCPKADEAMAVEYSPDMCPRTVDLTDRHVNVHVDQWWTERDCEQVAAALTKVFDTLYTRDGSNNWLDVVTPSNY